MPEPAFRIVRRKTPEGDHYQILWVEASNDGTLRTFGGPVLPEAESLEDLRAVLSRVEASLGKDVLDIGSLHFGRKESSSVRALQHDESVIPTGYYCYERTPRGKRSCPYWMSYENLPVQANGYCWYLGKGDVELQAEGHHSLLWDEVKECGVNPHVSDPAVESSMRWVADRLDAYIADHSDVDRIFVDFEIDPETKRKVIIVSGINGIEDPEDARVAKHFQQLAAVFASSDAPYQDVEPDTALSVGRDPALRDPDQAP